VGRLVLSPPCVWARYLVSSLLVSHDGGQDLHLTAFNKPLHTLCMLPTLPACPPSCLSATSWEAFSSSRLLFQLVPYICPLYCPSCTATPLQDNMFIFGALAEAVPALRKARADFKPDDRFLHVVNLIRTGQFGWADCECLAGWGLRGGVGALACLGGLQGLLRVWNSLMGGAALPQMLARHTASSSPFTPAQIFISLLPSVPLPFPLFTCLPCRLPPPGGLHHL
jgi:hypothetical protein